MLKKFVLTIISKTSNKIILENSYNLKKHKQYISIIKRLKIAVNADNIIITADKGNATVILNKRDYEIKLENILVDETTYKKENKCPKLYGLPKLHKIYH